MTRISKYATAAALAGMLALAAATPSQARWHGHWHHHGAGAGAAIGFGVGALVGAAAANAAYPGYDAQDYAYAPGPGDYGPRYYSYGSANDERGCTQSPGSIHYVPCSNAP